MIKTCFFFWIHFRARLGLAILWYWQALDHNSSFSTQCSSVNSNYSGAGKLRKLRKPKKLSTIREIPKDLSDWSVQAKVSEDVPCVDVVAFRVRAAAYCSWMDQTVLTLTSNDIDILLLVIWSFMMIPGMALVVVSESYIHHQWFAMEIQGFLEVSHFELHLLLSFEQHAFHKLLANESLRILLRSFWPPATWVPSLWIPQTASWRPKVLHAAIPSQLSIYDAKGVFQKMMYALLFYIRFNIYIL